MKEHRTQISLAGKSSIFLKVAPKGRGYWKEIESLDRHFGGGSESFSVREGANGLSLRPSDSPFGVYWTQRVWKLAALRQGVLVPDEFWDDEE